MPWLEINNITVEAIESKNLKKLDLILELFFNFTWTSSLSTLTIHILYPDSILPPQFKLDLLVNASHRIRSSVDIVFVFPSKAKCVQLDRDSHKALEKPVLFEKG